jgi:hypothetical protein
MKHSLFTVALVVACASPDTILRVDVTADATADATIDTLQFRIGSDAAEAQSRPSIDVAVPDQMAGESETLEVWGLADGQQVAYGTAMATPSLHATIDVSVELGAITCGAWCIDGSTECEGSGIATCIEGSDGCLAWSPPTGAACGSGSAAPPVACSMDGSPCDDYDACTQNDTCEGGFCSGTPLCTTAPANADPICSNGTCGFVCHTGYVSTGTACIVPQYIFATSTTFDGDLGGLAGADATCQSLATAAGLAGTYKAWLSDSTTAATDRLSHGSGYVLVDGTLIASSWTQLTSGGVQHAIDLDEHGMPLTSSYVWTDTNPDGSIALNLNNGADDCSAWTSGSNSEDLDGFGGDAASTDQNWSCIDDAFACNDLLHLYCLQQ